LNFKHEKPEACEGCKLKGKGLGYVPGTGPPDATVAYIGQGPGEQEAYYGVPFYENAPSGSMLRDWIRRAGGVPSRAWIDNTVRCWLPQGFRMNGRRREPYGNRTPTLAEQRNCWKRHGGPALETINPTWIVPVGAPAQQLLLGLKGERFVGTVHLRKEG